MSFENTGAIPDCINSALGFQFVKKTSTNCSKSPIKITLWERYTNINNRLFPKRFP